MLQRITGGHRPLKAVLDVDEFYNKESILNVIPKRNSAEQIGLFLAVINSSVGNWFYKKRFTNASKLTVNLSKEYVGKIPIKISALDWSALFRSVVALIQFAKADDQTAGYQFLEDLIDACVMECYFREHMAKRDLLFLDDFSKHLNGYDRDACESDQRAFLNRLISALNAPTSKIRNRLLRLTADSPDLLAVIKQEGKV